MSSSAAVSAFAPASSPPIPPTTQRLHQRRFVAATTLIVGTALAFFVAVVDDWHVGTDIGLRIPKHSSLTTVAGSAADRALVDVAARTDGELAVHLFDGIGITARPFIGDGSMVVVDASHTAPHTVLIDSDDAVVVSGSRAPLAVEVYPWQGAQTMTQHLIDVDGPLRLAHAAHDRVVLLPALLLVLLIAFVAGRIAAARLRPSDEPRITARRRRRALLLPAVTTPLFAMLVLHQLIVLALSAITDNIDSYSTINRDDDAIVAAIVLGVMALPTLALTGLTVLRARARIEHRDVDSGVALFFAACAVSIVLPAFATPFASFAAVVLLFPLIIVGFFVVTAQRSLFAAIDKQ